MTSGLPERLQAPNGLVVRRWLLEDAELLACAIAESLEHLRPWLPWAEQEPLPLERRRALIREWEQDWIRGHDFHMGVLVDGRVVGGCGAHPRIGQGGLEIGYWTHQEFLRRGIATTAVGLATAAALALPGITRVEIHHDKANKASAGVPRKLGYRFIGEKADQPVTPREVGILCRWRLTRDEWQQRQTH
jgi:RimJ/RimL family protein N-acetyltransferase